MIPERSSDRWLAGVAGGIAGRLGVEPIYVRVAFVSFGLLGFAAYLTLLMLSIDSQATADEPQAAASPENKLALFLMVMGGLVLTREMGLLPDFLLPTSLVLFGAAALWDRSTPEGRSRLTKLFGPDIGGAPTIGRTLGGVALLLGGLFALLQGVSVVQRAGWLAIGVAITAGGALLLFGPWIQRLATELRAERTRRIRADARAEVAAHLHDSVLQTLALIQRVGDDPRRVVTLARSQERELRSWLFGHQEESRELEPALAATAARVEEDHDVPIDVIVVGDAPVDEHVEALIAAAREAMVNAARHSGADLVSVYVEVGNDALDVWVTDQGRGFDLGPALASSVGIRRSIMDRMARHGGTADISTGSEGTEVHLTMPLRERVR